LNNNAYHKLKKQIESFAHGFPETSNGVEIKILKKLFTEEQAEIYCQIASTYPLLPIPGKPSSKRLQKKLKMTQEQLSKKMEAMAQQGLLFRQKYDSKPDEPFYFPPAFIVGLYEFSLKTIDKELASLCHEYVKDVAKWWNKIPTKQLRVVPVESSIKQQKGVWPYDKIDEIIKGHKIISVAECICMKEKKMLGQDCKAQLERCITFDWFAEHYIDTGIGRQITEQELKELLIMAEKKGLVISPSNMKDSIGFCLCCDCCCTWLRIIGSDPKPAMQVEASYRAEIDPDKCNQCGICIKRCNMKAINKEPFKVDFDRCIGCGLCVTTCPTKAIQMIKNGRTFELEKSAAQLFMKMHEEHLKANSFKYNILKNRFILFQIKSARMFYRAVEFFQKRFSKPN